MSANKEKADLFRHMVDAVVERHVGGRPPTAQEITDANRDRTIKFAELALKIPRVDPDTMREYFVKVKQFTTFVERWDKTLIDLTASPEHLPSLLRHWLSDVVDQSILEVKQDTAGIEELIEVATIQNYKSHAKRMLFYIYPPPSVAQVQTYIDDIETHVRGLIRARKLASDEIEVRKKDHQKAHSNQDQRVTSQVLPWLPMPYDVEDTDTFRDMNRTTGYLRRLIAPSFKLTPLIEGEKTLPAPERCTDEVEKYLSTRLSELMMHVPDGLLNEDGTLKLDHARLKETFQGLDFELHSDPAALKELLTAAMESIVRDVGQMGDMSAEESDSEGE
ncbi:uncharacterized protein IL334_000188 [Kwoniella shivajii]|uniref:Cytoplasmic protein n=1 Tax=Kwoniella shivajii TaxID=564305 RepID=A0ABZ1CPI5_9TREE|nr:hypothetical protein IL334_000188 [Kwoniella shivajii]